MIREERLARITEYVKERQYASVDELVALLGVSKATVRRDLTALTSSGQLIASWGGVRSGNASSKEEPLYEEKNNTLMDIKTRIGKEAAALVKPGMAIILDAGTTTRTITSFLSEIRGLYVATNDLMIALDLSKCSNINLTVAGGQLRRDYYTLRGYETEDSISGMRVDIGFLGFDLIDPQAGCFITNTDEASLKKCIIKAAKTVVAVADHTKFEGTSFAMVCPLEEIDILITDKQVSPEIVKQLQEAKIKVILA